MDVLQAIILGIVQGITEWLPVSSSAHLVIFNKMIGAESSIFFDILLHIASLIVVLFVFRKTIMRIIIGLMHNERMAWMKVLMLAIATVPIGLVGIFFNDLVKSAFNSITAVAVALLVTSGFLFLSRLGRESGSVTLPKSIFLGIAQALAIFPGISRSGTTISFALLLGIRREEAAEFSFLMFIPAILGALFFELPSADLAIGPAQVAGFVTTIVVGYLSLVMLLRIIRNNKFHYFGYYCLGLGALLLVL